MNEQSYEEYIRSILGYPSASTNMNNYTNNSYNNMEESMFYNQNSDNKLLEDCYPEIYKIVYPMVIKSCRNNAKPLTRELIENMTDEIYTAIENDHNEIGINITLNNEVKTSNTMNTTNNMTNNTTTNNRTMQNRNTNYSTSQSIRKEINKEITEPKNKVENRGEDRQFRNRNLRDLIQILLIRELLGRPGNFPPNRPPLMPPRPPMRPPFPGGPAPGRPPIMPRDN